MKWFNLARRVANLSVQLDAKTLELQAAHARIRDLEQHDRTRERDLIKAQGRISDLTDELTDAHRRTKEAVRAQAGLRDRNAGLEQQLSEYVASNATKARIADQNREVSALPPALNRDRANAVRLAFENDGLRTENEELRRQNARLAVLVDECNTKHGEGNPS